MSGNKKDIYDVNSYSEEELYRILDLNNPTDRELEAKILHLIWKYNNMENNSGKTLSDFFKQVYNHFFQDEGYEGYQEYELNKEDTIEGLTNMNDTPISAPKLSDIISISPPQTNLPQYQSITPTTIPLELQTAANTQSNVNDRAFAYNIPIDYSKDNLNPLLKQTTKRIISIDSQYRENKTSSSTNFTFNLSNPLKDVVSLKLYSFQIPYTWYTINNNFGSNFFYLKGNSNGINTSADDIKIQIPTGNYNPQSIVTAVNTAMSNLESSYQDISFGSTSITYNNVNSLATMNIDITKLYDESCYDLSFSVPKLQGATSIQKFLGFNYNFYTTDIIYSNKTILPVSPYPSEDVTTTPFFLSNNNNYFNIIQYLDTDKSNKYNIITSKVIQSFKITFSLPVNIAYSRQQLFLEMQNQLKTNSFFDISYCYFSRVDMSGSDLSMNIGYNHSHYELRIRMNRYYHDINIPNSKFVIIFPNDYDIWLGPTSTFVFDYQYNELSDIISETAITGNSVVFSSTPSINFDCSINYFDISLNNYVVNIPPSANNNQYLFPTYIETINNEIINTNNSSDNLSNPKGVFNISNTYISDASLNTIFNVDITKKFTNYDYYIDISNSVFVNKYGVTTYNGNVLVNTDTRYYGGYGIDCCNNHCVIVGKTGINGSNISYSNDSGNSWIKSSNGSQVFADKCNDVTHASYSYFKNTPNTINLYNFISLVCDNSGQNIIALSTNNSGTNYGGNIWISSNYGSTWNVLSNSITQNQNWKSITGNYNLSKIIAVSNNNTSNLGGGIYKSIDYGTTWVLNSSVTQNLNWNFITGDISGQYLLAVENTGIWLSKDSGSSWTKNIISSFASLTIVKNTSKIKALMIGSGFWDSSANNIYNWQIDSSNNNTIIKNQNWINIKSSDDGSYMYAISTNINGLGGIIWKYTSSNNSWVISSQTALQNQNWQAISCSSDGQRLVVGIYGGGLWLSDNYGSSYVLNTSNTNLLNNNWQDIVCDSSGANVIAIVNGGGIWKSSNYGATWTLYNDSNTQSKNWKSIVVNTTAQFMVSVASNTINTNIGGGIWISSNYGNLWNLVASTQNKNWVSVEIDASGQNVIALENYGGIWKSNDYGNTWIIYSDVNTQGLNWQKIRTDASKNFIAMTDNSTFISNDSGISWSLLMSPFKSAICVSGNCVGIINNGGIWRSTNFGNTWSLSTNIDTQNKLWQTITCDVNGKYLIAAISNDKFFSSSDYGNTWVNNKNPNIYNISWQSIDCDSTGQYLIAVSYCGGTWISNDYGSSWTQKSNNYDSQINYWTQVISDANFKNLYAIEKNGSIWISLDSGSIWNQSLSSLNSISFSDKLENIICTTNNNGIYHSTDTGLSFLQNTDVNTQSKNFNSTYSSIDGKTVFATARGDTIYISKDYGNSWVKNTQSSIQNIQWESIICDVSGNIAAATADNDGIYISQDAGNSWIHNFASFNNIVENYTGSVILASVNNGGIWVSDSRSTDLSNNYGKIWKTNTSSLLQNKVWDNLSIDTTGQIMEIVDASKNNFISTDYGSSWNINIKFFKSIACDSSGQYLVGVIYGGGIWTSYNSGNKWTQNPNPNTRYKKWQSVTSSNSGQYLAAVEYGGGIWTSTDYGLNWTLYVDISGNTTKNNWQYIASNASGSILFAVENGGGIWSSTNYGGLWTKYSDVNTQNKYWSSIAISADGSKLVAVNKINNNIGGELWVSTNTGIIWLIVSNITNQNWASVSSDETGQYLTAVVNGGGIWTSNNYGFFWTLYSDTNTQNKLWSSVAISDSNYNIMAVVNTTGELWFSRNAGTTWTKNIDPSGNLIQNNWKFLIMNNNGNNIYASSENNSLDSGCNYILTWNSQSSIYKQNANISHFSAITKSNTGVIIAVVYGGSIWTSTDFCYSWNQYIDVSGSTLNKFWNYLNNTFTNTLIAATVTNEKWISTNSGASWSLYPVNPSRNLTWKSTASDITGQKMVAVEYSGNIYTSVTSGVSWSLSGDEGVKNKLWNSVSSDSTGNYLIAVEYSGGIWTSDNSGNNWSLNSDTNTQGLLWNSVSSDATGYNLIAITKDNKIFITSNRYKWYNINYTSFNSKSISIDTSINPSTFQIVGVVYGGGIWTTYDSGVTWNISDLQYYQSWNSTISSSDGKIIINTADQYGILISKDNGKNWSNNLSSFISTCSSYNGNKNFATGNGGLWYSQNNGITWNKNNNSYLQNLNWVDIKCDLSGQAIIALENTNKSSGLWLSIDGGITWNNNINYYKITNLHLIIQPILESQDYSNLCLPNYYNNKNFYSSTQITGYNSEESNFLNINVSNAETYRNKLLIGQNSMNYSSGNGIFIDNISLPYVFYYYYNSTTSGVTNGTIDIISNNVIIKTLNIINNTDNYYYPNDISYNGLKVNKISIINSNSYAMENSLIYLSFEDKIQHNWYSLSIDNGINPKFYALDYGGAIYQLSVINNIINIKTINFVNDNWQQIKGYYDILNNYKIIAMTSNYFWTSINNGQNWSIMPSLWLYDIKKFNFTGPTCITSDSTGKYLVVSALRYIYMSNDYGITWRTTMMDAQALNSVKNSYDGKIIIVTGTYGIFISTDYGYNWNFKSFSLCKLVTMNSSSQYIYFFSDSDLIISKDYGVTFTTVYNIGNPSGLKSNLKGDIIIGCSRYNGHVFISYNYGNNWNIINALPTTDYSGVACNSTGQILIAYTYSTTIWISKDYGISWNIMNNIPYSNLYSGYFTNIIVDYSGKKLVAVFNKRPAFKYIYKSNDYGLTWEIINGPSIISGIDALDCNSTGEYIYVVTTSNYLWKITNWQSFEININNGNIISLEKNGGIITYDSSLQIWNINSNINTLRSWKKIISKNDLSKAIAIEKNGSIWKKYDNDVNNSQIGKFYITSSNKINNSGTYIISQTVNTNQVSSSICSDINCINIYVLIQPDLYTKTPTRFYKSINGGISWNTDNPINNYGFYFSNTTCNSTGRYVYITADASSQNFNNDISGGIFSSSNYGNTWTLCDVNNLYIQNVVFIKIACDYSGRYVSAIASSNVQKYPAYPPSTYNIWLSNNFGNTWNKVTYNNSMIDTTWRSISINFDGSIICAVKDHDVWISTDYGSTWVLKKTFNNNINLLYVVIDPSGNNIIIGCGDSVRISYDLGTTFVDLIAYNNGYCRSLYVCNTSNDKIIFECGSEGLFKYSFNNNNWTRLAENNYTYGSNWTGVVSNNNISQIIAVNFYNESGSSAYSTITIWIQNFDIFAAIFVNIPSYNNNYKAYNLQYISGTNPNISSYLQSDYFLMPGINNTKSYNLWVLSVNSNQITCGWSANDYEEKNFIYSQTVILYYDNTQISDFWLYNSNIQNQQWLSIANDICGNNIIATAQNNIVYFSSDGGNTWNINMKSFSLMTSDSTCTNIYGVIDAGGFWYSYDSGNTWTKSKDPFVQNQNWESLVCNQSGQIVLATTYKEVFKSTDYGKTWENIFTFMNISYYSVAMKTSSENISLSNYKTNIIFEGFIGVDNNNIIKLFYDFKNTNLLAYSNNTTYIDYKFDKTNNKFSTNGSAINNIVLNVVTGSDIVLGLGYTIRNNGNNTNTLSYFDNAGGKLHAIDSSMNIIVNNMRFIQKNMLISVGKDNVVNGNAISYSIGINSSEYGKYWLTDISNSVLNYGNHIIWTGTKLVATGKANSNSVNGNTIAYSYDGNNWMPSITNNFTTNGIVNSVAWDSSYNMLIATGTDLNGNTILYSADGIYWNTINNNPFDVSGQGYDVTCNGNLWVVVGASNTGNTIAYSSNGINWLSVSKNMFRYGKGNNVNYANNKFVAVGSGENTIVTSSNGINWSTSNNGSETFNNGTNAITFNGNVWIATGNTGFSGNSVAYSKDGSNWSSGKVYVNDLSWNAPFENGLNTASIYNIYCDSSGLISLEGLFDVSGSYVLTPQDLILTAYPNPNSGNKFVPPYKIYGKSTNSSLSNLQIAVNNSFISFVDTFNYNVMQSSYATFQQLSNTTVKMNLNIYIYKTLTQRNYKVVFVDPSFNTWNYYLGFTQGIYDLSLNKYNSIPNITYSQIVSEKQINTSVINISQLLGNNQIFLIPKSDIPELVPQTSEYALTISIPDGVYSLTTLINEINKQLNNNTITSLVTGRSEKIAYGSLIDISGTTVDDNKVIIRLNINKIFNATDYKLVFYDILSFTTFTNFNNTLQNIYWDSTLGWILGFRKYMEYQLYQLYNSISGNNYIISITGDTTLSVNIYNYFMIILDDYNQNHLNDGLVVTTQQENNIPLPSYSSLATLRNDPAQNSLIVSTLNKNDSTANNNITSQTINLTQKQIYAAQTALDSISTLNSQDNISKKYSSGPYAKDVFALLPLKVAGQQSNTIFVDFSGTLQNQERVYFGPVNIHRMSVSLVNDHGEIVDLNGANWSFSLICEQLYQQQKT